MATPRYEEIAARLAARIDAGEEWPAGSVLPQLRDLASEYGVSKGSLEKAASALEASGRVRAVRGTGLVVRARGSRRSIGAVIDRHPARGYVFPSAASATEEWQIHGRPQVARLPVPAPIANRLGIDAETETIRRRMVTSPVGEGPFQISDDWMHPDVIEQIPELSERSVGLGGVPDRLEQAGHGPLTWHRYTRPRAPLSDEAHLLEIPTAMWVLEMAYVAVSARTREPVAVMVRVVPADRAELVDTMQRTRAARWPVPPIEQPSDPIAIG